MGLIVAAPTAGSAGVVPGMLLALQECHSFSDNDLIKVLFNAGAIGYLAMRNATVAGAVGGCQAEVGIASAMAASAAVELFGGSPKQCLDAATIVLMNMPVSYTHLDVYKRQPPERCWYSASPEAPDPCLVPGTNTAVHEREDP